MQRADWWPSPDDVAVYVRARTKDRAAGGRELGRFSTTTVPTSEQVFEYIDTTVPRVYGRVGAIPEELEDSARRVAAIGAACLVELSHFQEQIRTGQSPYEQLKEWFDESLLELKESVDTINGGGDVGDDADELTAVADFPIPVDEYAILGWQSRF